MAEDMTDFFEAQAKEQEAAAEQPAATPKKERKKRQPRKAPAGAAPAAEAPAAPKNDRRKRAPRVEGKTRSAKVSLDIAITALAGLKPDEAQMVAAAASKLGGLPKRARSRIVGALARMFG